MARWKRAPHAALGEFPVFELEAGNVDEIFGVVSDEDEIVGEGDSGNHEVEIADHEPTSFEVYSDLGVFVRCRIVEWIALQGFYQCIDLRELRQR